MYEVILKIYTESNSKKGLKTKEVTSINGPFSSFEIAQNYMDDEIYKRYLTINNKLMTEVETNDKRDRASIDIEHHGYYRCYDYHIRKVK